MGATLDVFSVLYPQLREIDFRTQQKFAEEWFELLARSGSVSEYGQTTTDRGSATR